MIIITKSARAALAGMFLLASWPAWSAPSSGCMRDYNEDGTPTECFEASQAHAKECPPRPAACLDSRLAGAWIQDDISRHKDDLPNNERWLVRRFRMPYVRGWIIDRHAKVRPMAIDFASGRLAAGSFDYAFLELAYACQGDFRPVSVLVGALAESCGEYRLADGRLQLSWSKGQAFDTYVAARLGDPYTQPVRYHVDLSLDGTAIVVPKVWRTVPARALYWVRNGERKLKIEIDTQGLRLATLSLKLAPGEGAGVKKAGLIIRKNLNDHVVQELRSVRSPEVHNRLRITRLDLDQGRLVGSFDHLVEPLPSARNRKQQRVVGRFDLPIYSYPPPTAQDAGQP